MNTLTENLVFFRMSRLVKGEAERYSEKTVKYCLSAWVRNIERSMDRLKNGEKVFTPYAVYFAMPVDEWKTRGAITSDNDIMYE